jgi:hypothetical protein
MATFKARFMPANPQKYIGDVNRIFARSSWEITVMKFFDSSNAVMRWGSEVIKIPYVKPTDGRVHHYFPDFIVAYKDKDGNLQREIIEVKPMKETHLTAKSSLYDKIAIAINEAKWTAASAFAAANGMSFRVITEASIYKSVPQLRNKPRKKRK